eukprot:s2231_g10.t3
MPGAKLGIDVDPGEDGIRLSVVAVKDGLGTSTKYRQPYQYEQQQQPQHQRQQPATAAATKRHGSENFLHPDKEVHPGHCILEVNGFRGTAEELKAACRVEGELQIRLRRNEDQVGQWWPSPLPASDTPAKVETLGRPARRTDKRIVQLPASSWMCVGWFLYTNELLGKVATLSSSFAALLGDERSWQTLALREGAGAATEKLLKLSLSRCIAKRGSICSSKGSVRRDRELSPGKAFGYLIRGYVTELFLDFVCIKSEYQFVWCSRSSPDLGETLQVQWILMQRHQLQRLEGPLPEAPRPYWMARQEVLGNSTTTFEWKPLRLGMEKVRRTVFPAAVVPMLRLQRGVWSPIPDPRHVSVRDQRGVVQPVWDCSAVLHANDVVVMPPSVAPLRFCLRLALAFNTQALFALQEVVRQPRMREARVLALKREKLEQRALELQRRERRSLGNDVRWSSTVAGQSFGTGVEGIPDMSTCEHEPRGQRHMELDEEKKTKKKANVEGPGSASGLEVQTQGHMSAAAGSTQRVSLGPPNLPEPQVQTFSVNTPTSDHMSYTGELGSSDGDGMSDRAMDSFELMHQDVRNYEMENPTLIQPCLDPVRGNDLPDVQ